MQALKPGLSSRDQGCGYVGQMWAGGWRAEVAAGVSHHHQASLM